MFNKAARCFWHTVRWHFAAAAVGVSLFVNTAVVVGVRRRMTALMPVVVVYFFYFAYDMMLIFWKRGSVR